MDLKNLSIEGLEKIGRGEFSTVFKKDKNKVLVASTDPVRYIMSKTKYKSRLIPKYELIGKSKGKLIYQSKLYNKGNSYKQVLNERSYQEYKELANAYKAFYFDVEEKYLYTFLNSLKSSRIKKALREIFDSLVGKLPFSEVYFEISPRNIASDKNGNLILLDCFLIVQKQTIEQIHTSITRDNKIFFSSYYLSIKHEWVEL